MARVLLDSPLPQLDRLFDYAVPPDLDADAQPGVRVKVPLRSAGRMIDGFVVERAWSEPSQRPLSELDSVISPVPVLPGGLYELARKVADRAAGSASDVLRLAVPKRMVRAEKSWLLREPPTAPVVAPEVVRAAEDVLDAFPTLRPGLTDRERMALDAPPRPVVIGEGRTVGAWAVLVAAAAAVTLAAGRSVVIVVPDHRDQEQVVSALEGKLPVDAVVPVDARQSGPARYAAYLRTLSDAPCVVVGNRSAVYAPVAALGLVVIWDDGDPLLAEPLSPGVHARDAALVRQELEASALLILGHTRTTDVERLVGLGWLRDVPARRRQSPRVVLTATSDAPTQARIPSSAFAAVREALASGPVLVQVARPGYAPVVVCSSCRHPARCVHCTGPLRVRGHGRAPECGWCGRGIAGWVCPHCSATEMRLASSGSERTADELGRAFPNTRVILADRDHALLRVDARPALVVATRGAEPVADGGYRAVLLLDGDRMLLAEDLRITESCLRWWSNAAALAAPGSPVMLTGVAGAVARALATWTQPAYARSELAERAPLKMPPTVRVAVVEGTRPAVDGALSALARDVHELTADAVVGPVPIPSDDVPRVRALVRFDYAHGRAVAQTLRASVVAEAVAGRRSRAKGRAAVAARNTLRVRVDVPDPDL
ncbi:primosomal protein N' [Microbacterium sp. cx-55]|uniref:primosomal protein N' family DNA-binding protein n=1 Tax=Microbacterium sp. cx-55 TaxID=2875948 RepID=UPI001CBC9513|nr:primosomal protein N' [Microbacterium sp. cx-55]UGB36692.1 primosomal protein N' [Microbacterium sp. cx-55]